jgi:hypothetical protein
MKLPTQPSRGVTVAVTKRTLDELAALGKGIFDRQVRQALRPEDDGKFVAIDVEPGDYEIDSDDYSAVTRLRSRKPAGDVWLMRAGYPTTYKIAIGDGPVGDP